MSLNCSTEGLVGSQINHPPPPPRVPCRSRVSTRVLNSHPQHHHYHRDSCCRFKRSTSGTSRGSRQALFASPAESPPATPTTTPPPPPHHPSEGTSRTTKPRLPHLHCHHHLLPPPWNERSPPRGLQTAAAGPWSPAVPDSACRSTGTIEGALIASLSGAPTQGLSRFSQAMHLGCGGGGTQLMAAPTKAEWTRATQRRRPRFGRRRSRWANTLTASARRRCRLR